MRRVWTAGPCPMGSDRRRSGVAAVDSLDELPELWNVLKEEMSLVGPRPLLTTYLPPHASEQVRPLKVRPGITGWRNALNRAEKFALALWDDGIRSGCPDLGLSATTVRKVSWREGIAAAGSAPMPIFRGAARRGSVEDGGTRR
jgi:hypothetical protein